MAAVETLSVRLQPPQVDLLLNYLELLQRWNGTYNLTAVRDPVLMLTQHLVDCLAVIPSLKRHTSSLRGTIGLLDVGSGGGLPGVVIAVACPDIRVTCVDAVGKKSAFVRQVAAELRLGNLRCEHARVEKLALPPFDLITSRAFASLENFASLTRGLIKADGVWMAMKGKRPESEFADLPANISVFHVEHLSIPGLDAERCLVWMRPLSAAMA